MFGTPSIRKWRTKVEISGFIRKETDNKPGTGVSVYQIHSAHPGLVAYFLGKLTIAQIRDAQVMVEHFSDITYVHLLRSTSH